MSNTVLSFDVSSTRNLTITSVLYNPTNHVSDWVDTLFGSKAIINQAYIDDTLGILYDVGKEPLNHEEIFYRSQRFREKFSLPPYALWPGCSVDLLGYVHLSDEGPFTPSLRAKVFVGKAILTIEKRSMNWDCYYRPVYENWRTEKNYSSPNYWAVVFFCPSPYLDDCEAIESRYDAESVNNTSKHLRSEFGKVSMKTPTGSWWNTTFKSIPFTTKKQQYKPYYSTRNDATKVNDKTYIDSSPGILLKPRNIPPAVCLSIPYTSTDAGKEVANGAILLEWIRYYTLLGFKVLIYDRDGANRKHIFNSTYGKAQNIRIPRSGFVYHPYTVRGVLDPSKKGLKYDNTESKVEDDDVIEELRKGRFESQGHDKVLTLTHCRFEAKALYGIETVLIADFDEFLYCPVVGPTARAQGGWIHQFLSHMKALGVSQIEFSQRVVVNKTKSPRDCIVNHVKNGWSIFDCFSSYLYYNGAHSLKSLHLDHSCPLTGYHNACPGNESPRSHDCSCTSHIMKSNNCQPYEHLEGRECSLIHLSTNDKSYGRKEYALTGDEKILSLKSVLEISLLVNVNKKKKIVELKVPH